MPDKYSTQMIISLLCHYSWNPQFLMQYPAQSRLSECLGNKQMNEMNDLSENAPANPTYEIPHTFPKSARIPPSRWYDLNLRPPTENKSSEGLWDTLLWSCMRRSHCSDIQSCLWVEEWIKWWLTSIWAPVTMLGVKDKWDIPVPWPHRQPGGRNRKTCNYSQCRGVSAAADAVLAQRRYLKQV